jgi:hypothetical protein
MDISKLKRRFIREAKASPKKVAVLVVVTIVAAWKIAPLATGIFSGPTETASTAAPAPAATVTAANRLPASSPTAVRPSWRESAARISSDPLMRSAEPTGAKDPFADLQEPDVASAQVEKADEPEPTLSAAGLVLSSTVVGPSRRTALINGRIYAEGDLLDLPGTPVAVVAIRPRGALLESNGERLELTIAEQTASQKIQVRREQ